MAVGGLLQVAERSPELIPVIMTIPYAEFSPRSPNFRAAIIQIVKVLSIPKLIDLLRAAWGAQERSQPAATVGRFIWEAAQSRFHGCRLCRPALGTTTFGTNWGYGAV